MEIVRGEDANRRIAYRTNLPAEMYIAGRRVRVLDWSVKGLRCECLGDGTPFPDDPFDIRFTLPVRDVGFIFKATVKLEWQEGCQAGFVFTAIPDDAREMLKKYVAMAAGGEVETQDLLPPEYIPPENSSGMAEAMHDTPHDGQNFVSVYTGRTALFAALALLVLTVAGYFTYRSTMVAISVRGVISGAAVEAVAPLSEAVASVDVAEGQAVAAGDVLVRLNDAKPRREIAEAQLRVETVRQELQALNIQLSEENKALGLYSQAAQRRMQVAEQELAETKALLHKARVDEKRAKDLLSRDVVSRDFAEQASRDAAVARARYERAQRELALSREVLDGARDGKFFSDGRVQGQARELAAQAEVLRSRLGELAQRRDNLVAGLDEYVVRSPVDGRVYTLRAKQGGFAVAGTSLATIAAKPEDDSGKQFVLARFTFEEGRRIGVGDEAKVRIASSNLTLQGRVVALGHQALSSGALVSQDHESSLNEVPVKVALDGGQHLDPGLGAVVEIVQPWREMLPAW